MRHNLYAGIPEELTRFVQLPNERGHNAVWDFVRSPDGRFFISVCGENEKPLTALLYEYYPETGELRLIFDVADIWIVHPEQMPPSKIHTSIDFLPNGRLIMATHNTAPAQGHPYWLYEQHYEHPWEGYPGSIVMIVNPDTNEVQVRGIPVPRESMYGGMLGNDPRFYYFLGYMRGHFYRLDLETNEVRDYGKVSEFSSCRLAKDERGRLYGSAYTGGLWRYDPEKDEIEDLKISFHSPNGTKVRRQFIFALNSPRGTLFLVDNCDGEMLELHPETLELTRHGHIHLPDAVPEKMYLIGGLAADENFVMYYGLKTYDEDLPIRLVRWDILGGGQPENLGLIAPRGKASQYICEMLFDRHGWLHMVDVCGQFSPYIVAVDIKQLQVPSGNSPKLHLEPYVEPNFHSGADPATYMQIEAETTRTLPLHKHLNWRDTSISHVKALNGKVYGISGKNRTYLTEFGETGDSPSRISIVYEGGAPLSCVDVDEGTIAMLASDGCIVYLGCGTGSCMRKIPVPDGIELVKLHFVLDAEAGSLLASDRNGAVYIWSSASGGSNGEGSLRKLDNIQLQTADAHISRKTDTRWLFSGSNDEIHLYDAVQERSETLQVKSASIRGRAFRATITGGAILADGTIVAGTHDGMLFTLSPDLRQRTVYGRLYSSGQLRNFIKLGDNAVAGVYGGEKDAGHVFYFSSEHGFVDLGRPRVIKDNNPMYDLDSEWASIHNISCLAYAQEEDSLYVASGEQYGCIVRYTGVTGISLTEGGE